MANIPPIQFKRSHVSGRIPDSDDLLVGEIAINMADNKLYTKDSDGLIRNVGGSSGGAGIRVVDSDGILFALAPSDPTIRNKDFAGLVLNPIPSVVTYDSDSDRFIRVGGLFHIQEFPTIQAMALDNILNGHVEGALYKVQRTDGLTMFFQHNGTRNSDSDASDYSLISRSSISYANVGLMVADQTAQQPGGIYLVDSEVYVWNGTRNNQASDYVYFRNAEVGSDPAIVSKENSTIYGPSDIHKWYNNIYDAEADGTLTIIGSRAATNNWNYRNIVYSGQYWEIVVPAGTSVMTLGWINDRSTSFHAKYEDGNQEYIGVFSGGNFYQWHWPSPWGSTHGGWNHPNAFLAIDVPVIHSNVDRTIRISSAGDGQMYMHAIGFCSSNIWDYTWHSSLGLHRQTSITTALWPDRPVAITTGNRVGYYGGTSGIVLGIFADYANHSLYLTATTTDEQLIYFVYRSHDATTAYQEGQVEYLRINGVEIKQGLVASSGANPLQHTNKTVYGSTMQAGWDTPLSRFAAASDVAIVYALVPAGVISLDSDGAGHTVPTPQEILLRTPDGVNTSTYPIGGGFIRHYLQR